MSDRQDLDKLGLKRTDLAALEERGIPLARIADQIMRLRAYEAALPVIRPATLGDGIKTLDELDDGQALASARDAARAGRLSSFVPASGDATRLFERLIRADENSYPDRTSIENAATDGNVDAGEAAAILSEIGSITLKNGLTARGYSPDASWPDLLSALASRENGLAGYPKGLIPFHSYGDTGRTAVEEHVFDSVALGCSAITFTVQERHIDRFERTFDALLKIFDGSDELIEIGWKLQDSRFDAVALDEGGNPFREHGALLFRPGGHGVLIHTLSKIAGDIVTIRNIDNVVHGNHKSQGHEIRARMVGIVAGIKARIDAGIKTLRAGGDPAEALAPLDGILTWRWDELEGDENQKRSHALTLLDRPFRLCGMVQDMNHKGGGPFWAMRCGEVGLQIVEDAQFASDDPEQAKIIAGSTHFNPVDIVAAVRDADGKPYDLARFCDEDAVIMTQKSRGAATMRVFEYPGLWNGGMGNWNTLFVDVPAEIFNPVKYLSDLLKICHRG